MSVTFTARELLTKLADRYEADPSLWRRDGSLRDNSFCVLHGLARVQQEHDAENRYAYHHARSLLHNVVGPVIDWNDVHAKDVKEVIEMLRQAAAR